LFFVYRIPPFWTSSSTPDPPVSTPFRNISLPKLVVVVLRVQVPSLPTRCPERLLFAKVEPSGLHPPQGTGATKTSKPYQPCELAKESVPEYAVAKLAPVRGSKIPLAIPRSSPRSVDTDCDSPAMSAAIRQITRFIPTLRLDFDRRHAIRGS